MAASASQWLPVQISGCQCNSVAGIASQWLPVKVSGCHCKSVVGSASQCLSLQVSGCQWKSVAVNTSKWLPVTVIGCQCLSGCHYQSEAVSASQWLSLRHFSVAINTSQCLPERQCPLSRSILFQRTVKLFLYTTELFQTADGKERLARMVRKSGSRPMQRGTTTR